ncbi:hypothetical protein ABEB36_006434 [Hypothenemus hampei]|uniref:Gamma-glutamylcyclotransferase family protein n=1 Tax=Hypothenemus hampei TaxID=57062 RepID=A0ABD1ETH2_HYPHA
MALHRVFVYGTLKRSEPNHGLLESNPNQAKFLFEAQTKEKFPLIIGTQYNIPFLLYAPGKGFNVKGEVYEVDDQVLHNLDQLEDHPNFYIRDLYEVQTLDGSHTENVWIYMIKTFNEELQKPNMESYSNLGAHGLRYVSSEVDVSSLEDLK